MFAARIKKYFEQHGRIQVKQWYHFVDSQTVLGAIQHESYGFQTFFANRIGVIQSSMQLQDWCRVPGPLNIADIITRGAGPRDLDENSTWQQGPKFLYRPTDEWPINLQKLYQQLPERALERCRRNHSLLHSQDLGLNIVGS